MSASPFLAGSFFDPRAVGLTPGAALYSYAAGTLTPLATFTGPDGLSANTNPVICNQYGQADVFLGAAPYKFRLYNALIGLGGALIDEWDNVASAGQILTDLANSTDATKGADLVGYDPTVTYATPNRLGVWLNVLCARSPAEIAAGVTPTVWQRDEGDVRRYGSVGDGATNDQPAFAAAWSVVKIGGGTLFIPPRTHLLNSQWVCDIDLSLPHNYQITGYGATLLAGAAVTGHAIQVTGSFNNHGLKIEGLQFNHRGNGTVNGAIQALGTNYLRVVKCSVELHSNKATYGAIELGPTTPGNNDTNAFWTLIDGFTTRKRSGADGGVGVFSPCGVRIRGTANSTKIINSSFSSVTDAVRMQTDGIGIALNNAIRIFGNDFEGVTNAVTVLTNGAVGASTPVGLKIHLNRVEDVVTFFNITGAATTDPGNPPDLRDNYLTVGSVTNYMLNPNNQIVFSDESSFFGVGARNVIGGPSDYELIMDGSGHNLILNNFSGNSTWDAAHLVLGTYHIWVDTGSGKLYIKNGPPGSATDGTVVGTQT
ncbi:MAG: hypothetical protein V4792_10000 [Pseudomonadota bacterium]